MDGIIETDPIEYFVEVEFWEEFPLRKFFTTIGEVHTLIDNSSTSLMLPLYTREQTGNLKR